MSYKTIINLTVHSKKADHITALVIILVAGKCYRAVGKVMGVEGIDTINDENIAAATIAAVSTPADLKSRMCSFCPSPLMPMPAVPKIPRDTSAEEVAALYRRLM